MICSTDVDPKLNQFEKLLSDTLIYLRQEAAKDGKYFLSRKGVKFEEDVFEAMKAFSKNTPFEEKIKIISGQKFPDIVAYLNAEKGYGVEVKTTTQDHWKTTGNSVFESKRVEGIERIFLFFGKLADPVEFKCRNYEDCLSNVAVTHSPRYLIDMDLEPGKTIFDKVEMPYDTLRNLDQPFDPIKKYFRKNLKKGEDVWWMDNNGDDIVNPIIRLWSILDKEEKKGLINQAMILFPEVFNSSSTKYNRWALWLIKKHGIVNTSIRDAFTAGGKQKIELPGKQVEVPKIYWNLLQNLDDVLSCLETISLPDLAACWPLKKSQLEEMSPDEKLNYWLDCLKEQSAKNKDWNKLDINIAEVIRKKLAE